jgi:D-3-phosphoglycerate dehydrogenase
MKVILQEDLLQRSREVFNSASRKFNIEFIPTKVLDEKKMLEYHKKGVKCFIVGAEAYSREFYGSLQEDSAVIRYGVGYNAVPVDICRDRKIKVGYTPGTLTDSVAEHTFALLLSVVRKIPALNQSFKNNEWKGLTGVELRNKTLAVIGYGQIGQAVAKIAKYGFGMKVHAFDHSDLAPDNVWDLYTTNFDEVVRAADVVSIHLGTTSSTTEFIDAHKIDSMKDGVIFINTARGELINEENLFKALKNGKIQAAGLDVFTREPYKANVKADFRKLKNVVLTPHCGSNTSEASRRMAELVIENVKAYFAGTKMLLIPELIDLDN